MRDDELYKITTHIDHIGNHIVTKFDYDDYYSGSDIASGIIEQTIFRITPHTVLE